MARDRQRAKQRKARRAGQNPGPAPSEPRRENLPGELEHASGEADQFDATLVSGAGGEPSEEEDRAATAGDARPSRSPRDPDFDEDLEPDFDEDDDAELDERTGARDPAVATAPAPARGSALARFMAFLRASWAELQRVQWPDRRQVFQATAVVLGFVIVAGVYLGVADRVAQEVVNLII